MRRRKKLIKKGFRQAVKKARRIAAARGRPLRVMFADEARFGRMNRPRPCWAPAGARPKVASQLVPDITIIGYGMLPDILGRLGQEVFQVAYPADRGWRGKPQERRACNSGE